MKRKPGACIPCCDHLEPSCSQCSKDGSVCEKRTFKLWTPRISARTKARKTNQDSPATVASVSDHATCHPLDEGDSGDKDDDWSRLYEFDGLSTWAEKSIDGDDDYVQEQGFMSTPHDLSPHQTSVDLPLDHAASRFSPSRQKISVANPSFHPSLVIWPLNTHESSARRFLWHYFIHSIHERFLCFDNRHAASLAHQQNPFAAFLPRMAIRNAPLHSTILHFSASAYEKSHGRNRLQLTSETLLNEVLGPLLSLGVRMDHIENVLTVIVTGVLLYLTEPSDRGNFLELARSAAAYLADSDASNFHLHRLFYQFAMALLRWALISSSCFLPLHQAPVNLGQFHRIEQHDIELDFNTACGFNDWISDPVFAFSTNLVNPLLRLGRILRLQSTCAIARVTDDTGPFAQTGNRNIDDEREGENEEDASRLEEDLLNALATFQTAAENSPADTVSLLRYNESMHVSALLLFYTRIRRLPFTHPVIRHYVRQILDLISGIQADSCVSRAMLFPLGISGCEAIDKADRDMVLALLEAHNGVMSIHNLVPCLRQVWIARDLDPGLTWPHWMDKGKFSLNR
ncbi:hypothetical protein BS50DRAFT_630923 [Corynespora cassiicola Philippines]|uniref:Zn(2)-C6 fungal-type domain-containing protein n=1 Tax=Corynespora cassiicola Philippines TaxID=1448308 RepID=A0A2T2NZL7_CORCC|nr:hypothetical protein BS50DRAFT_630923 [Corynespora cassiicola Philippines]